MIDLRFSPIVALALAALFSDGYETVLSAAEPPITAIAFAPDDRQVVTASQAGVQIRSWPELQPLRELSTKLSHIHDLAFAKNGRLAVAGGAPGELGQVEVFSWPQGERLRDASPHEDLIYAVDWAADGQRLLTASGDHRAKSIDEQGGAVEFRGHSKPLLAAAFLPGDKLLVTAGRDRSLRVWDVDRKLPLRTLDNHTADVRDLAVRPGTAALPMVASAGADGTVRLWQPTIGRLVRFAQLERDPLAIAWTRDGRRLVASCVDGRVRVIDPDTVQVIANRPAIEGWAYSLAAAKNGSVAVGGHGGQVVRVPLGVE